MNNPIIRRPWTTKEEKDLGNKWGVMLATEIAVIHERTVSAISTRAMKLGLVSKLPYKYCTKSSNELKELISFGYCATDIAKMKGKTTKNIYNTCRNRSDLGGKWYRMLKQNTQLQRDNSGIKTPVY